MKILLVILLSLIFCGLGYFIYLGYKSQNGITPGLLNGKLSPCSSKPNCICTEFPNDKTHYTQAIANSNLDIKKVRLIIEGMDGKIIVFQDDYIAATFTSKLFRYVDDFEVRLDNEKKLLHVRSASRVGHSDMGANLKRLDAFKKIIN